HARMRAQALDSIGRALPPVSGALLGGLLLGTRGELPRETLEDFRRAGVYHILAVSGFNVALLASATFTALVLVRVPRRMAAGAAMTVVLGFACVAGPEPSVIRAAIMGVLVLGALVLDREASVVNSLALAGIAILAIRPGDLADPGFQLSFAATLGIVLAPLPAGTIAASIGVSLAAQLAVLPITLSHFNQVSTIGILANLAVVPLAAVATVLGLVAVLAAAVSDAVAAPFFEALWPVLLLLRAIVRLAAAMPGALVHLPAPHWTAVATYAGALGLGLLAWRMREARRALARAVGAVALLLLLVACVIELWPIVRSGDGRLRVAILDVGQGDAIVIESPDRRAFLIDAGSGGPRRLDAGERVVAPYLWNRGFLRLAGIVTTHADVDHAGGMTAIRRLFRVDEDLSAAPNGARRSLGGVLLTIRTADEPGTSRVLTKNDAARVVTLEYVSASFLLASDIGAAAERVLADHGGVLAARGDGLRATVLKVAHHGSRHSSSDEFLGVVQPAIAVISVGARNAYGHPDADTIRRLERAGARVYRTDRDGAVILETDGRTLEVTRWADGARDRYCLDPDTA
ncbi:MAG TPA: DNA internalization-related competence protein ComEC/Rec2, partial [Solirubrobacteraceae bacterium]